jgi:large subunit ribosomal protein L13
MKSFYPKEGEVERKWYVVDLKGKVLGRTVSEIAKVLMGKNKPQYTPSVDTGDFVVALNSDHIVLTGNKWQDKLYYRHTGYFGGIKSTTAGKQRQKDSTRIVYHAVKGMLPKNKLAEKLIKKLKVDRGSEHENQAQQPVALEF